MPTFDTPGPIQVTLEFDIASVQITATDRTDTVVTVIPADPASGKDTRAAEQTKVTFDGSELVVRAPKRLSIIGPGRNTGSIDLSVEVPAGSAVRATGPMAHYTCAGPLGEVRLSTSMGNITVAEAGVARLKTSFGDVRLDHARGEVEISGCGRLEIGSLDAAATVKNSNGDISISRVAGAVRATTANGDISVEQAGADVDTKTASGAIRIGEVRRGSVQLRTAAGNLAVGIGPTTAAWLDLNTSFGSVRNTMTESSGPGEATDTVEVRARTSYGDITITRA
jgi:hypothetical protein